MLAPPWIPVPAPAYGGIEEVVRLLCDGLTAAGHDVTLFAPPGLGRRAPTSSRCSRTRIPTTSRRPSYEADHVARAFAADRRGGAERGEPFDVIHDHVGHAALAMADRVAVPLVHTLHGPFTEDACRFYAEHGRKA